MISRPWPGAARLVLLASVVAGAALFIAVVIAAATKPGESILTGIFSGLFGGLFVIAAGGWLAMWLAATPPTPVPFDEAKADRVTAGLGQVLAELEVARKLTVQQINARARWRVPLCALIFFGLWLLPDQDGNASSFSDLVGQVGFGMLIGYVWASSKLGTAYRLLYKERVLPLLAAQFGDLSWRVAVLPDLSRWRAAGIFDDFQNAIAEDELFGTHRNLPLSIIELRLESTNGDSTTVHFNGLLTEITLPRHLNGSTAIAPAQGGFHALVDWLGRGGRTRVKLEDARFEALYQVWSTDQIAARALLTPAFMERLLALAGRGHFGRPVALVDDNRLTMAIPRSGGPLLEPPSYSQPAASRTALVALYDDIAAVLAVADTVIDLDFAARVRAQDSPD
jgi:hypothetical protein